MQITNKIEVEAGLEAAIARQGDRTKTSSGIWRSRKRRMRKHCRPTCAVAASAGNGQSLCRATTTCHGGTSLPEHISSARHKEIFTEKNSQIAHFDRAYADEQNQANELAAGAFLGSPSVSALTGRNI